MDILLLKTFTNSSTICTWSLVNLSDCIELESIFILLSIIFATSLIVLFIECLCASDIYKYWYLLAIVNNNIVLSLRAAKNILATFQAIHK